VFDKFKKSGLLYNRIAFKNVSCFLGGQDRRPLIFGWMIFRQLPARTVIPGPALSFALRILFWANG
jgi:hypothetical protein